ncbi:MAG TPA: penicillin-binding transpeptidase domain-containing protein [Gammaproteobacteria bacterium]|jgi:cell division protein FtsI (penicillin-binding protein 3)|nr:penicillin-binding transpeptidase domain-containing protein [Gammaproteobacteria bacterium]
MKRGAASLEQKPGASATGWRSVALLAFFTLVAAGLIGRAVYLQVLDKQFLLTQGAERHLRVVEMPAHRGMILDRNGQPLAVSTPVDSIWMNPQELPATSVSPLARALGAKPADLAHLIKVSGDKEFVYLARGMDPYAAQQVMALNLPGVYTQREYRRYYPAGEVTAQVLGFTNVDDQGQEGLELGYNGWLKGVPGAERVIVDRYGRSVQDVENLRAPRAGQDMTSSIDLRIQYLAYRALKQAVLAQGAKSGSIVVMDSKTGEVLAMANQPSFNPNNRSGSDGDDFRNRAVTDMFEPGSSMKPFTMVAALLSGKYQPGSIVDTSPGTLRLANYIIHDDGHDYGRIDLTTIIEKSSNVGASKVALSLPPEFMWRTLDAFGFGRGTGSGFPGESSGNLPSYRAWNPTRQATISYGYGVAITALQLADAYDTLADGGMHTAPSFVRLADAPMPQPVIPPQLSATLRGMLETVVSQEGTGKLADIAGYHVAGKTGTAHVAVNGGYSADKYISVFAGMAPASDPRLVTVVVINQPTKDYFGGTVSAPVFAQVMRGALRLLDVMPDDLDSLPATSLAVNQAAAP